MAKRSGNILTKRERAKLKKYGRDLHYAGPHLSKQDITEDEVKEAANRCCTESMGRLHPAVYEVRIHNLEKTIRGWQGLTALFFVSLLIVLATGPGFWRIAFVAGVGIIALLGLSTFWHDVTIAILAFSAAIWFFDKTAGEDIKTKEVVKHEVD